MILPPESRVPFIILLIKEKKRGVCDKKREIFANFFRESALPRTTRLRPAPVLPLRCEHCEQQLLNLQHEQSRKRCRLGHYPCERASLPARRDLDSIWNAELLHSEHQLRVFAHPGSHRRGIRCD